jgi:hypothetical protein
MASFGALEACSLGEIFTWALGICCARRWRIRILVSSFAYSQAVEMCAVLDNQETRAYDEQHRSWRGSSRKRAKPLVVASPTQPPAVKPGRDEQRVRQRYLRMSKEALVERLITAERTLAEQRERWLSQQDDVLTWRLRAEAAETQLQDLKANAIREKQ